MSFISLPISNALVDLNGLIRCATFGDSTASTSASPATCDVSSFTTTFAAHSIFALLLDKWQVPSFYPGAYLVANGGISGQTLAQMLARDSAASSATRKAIQDVCDLKPNVVFLRAGSINNILAVTGATLDAVVAATYADHIKVINRFLSAGVYVIDEGFYGYSGVGATDPDATRAALVQLNILYANYASSRSNRMRFINWIGVLSLPSGAFLSTSIFEPTGIHLTAYGQYLAAALEGATLTSLFGSSKNVRYQGVNQMKNAAVSATGGNSLMAQTSAVGYGTVPTGFSVSVANGTRQNAIVQVLQDQYFATCEIVPNAAACSMTFNVPLDSANFSPAVGDVWAVEMGFYFSGLNGAAPPSFSTVACAWDFTSVNNIVLQPATLIYTPVSFPVTGGVFGRFVSAPFVFPADTAALTLAEMYFKLQSDDQVSFVAGVSNPRLIKLGTSLTWPPVSP